MCVCYSGPVGRVGGLVRVEPGVLPAVRTQRAAGATGPERHSASRVLRGCSESGLRQEAVVEIAPLVGKSLEAQNRLPGGPVPDFLRPASEPSDEARVAEVMRSRPSII